MNYVSDTHTRLEAEILGCFVLRCLHEEHRAVTDDSPDATAGAALRVNIFDSPDFRDRYPATNAPGRAFVRFYYAHSPAVADFIAPREHLRAATRLVLWPVVYAVVHPHAALVVMIVLVGGLSFTRRLRRGAVTAGSTTV
jgi:hypothetical protein